MNKLNIKNLFNSIYPFFLTFIVGRLINQTDLIMASKISTNAAAAFAIPVRVSVIDMIFAFSLAPVISIFVAQKNEPTEREHLIQKCLSFTFYLSILLTIIGLITYPLLVTALVPDGEIAILAINAVTWLTLSIPMRLCYFAVSMAIHGTGNGRYLPVISLLNLALNFSLNYLFVYPLGFGFSGIYMATFITSIVSLMCAFFILQKKSGIKIKLVKLEIDWCLSFIKKQAAEFSRVASDRFVSFTEIAIVASALGPALLSFSVGAEFLFLLYTPFLAILRGSAIEIAKSSFANFDEKYDSIRKLSKYGFIILAVLSLGLISLWKVIAQFGYNLPDESLEWWKYIYIFGCIAIPFKWIDALQRATFQADGKIEYLAKIDITIDWFLSIPLLFLGIYQNSAPIAFSFFAIAPALKIGILHLKAMQIRKPIFLNNKDYQKI